MDCSADRATSPVAFAALLHSSGTAGTAVRLATAKAPDGAGSVAATGHVVAPALSCDGPGTIFSAGLAKTVPDTDIYGCYPAQRRTGRPTGRPTGTGRYDRDYLPAPQRTPLPDRNRGDRPLPACRARARSGFGRDVSLSSEPAPQNLPLLLSALSARNGHGFVAMAGT